MGMGRLGSLFEMNAPCLSGAEYRGTSLCNSVGLDITARRFAARG